MLMAPTERAAALDGEAISIGATPYGRSVPCIAGVQLKGGGKRMRRSLVVGCVGVVLLAVATGASAAIQSPIQSPVKLPANVLPALGQATPVGAAPDTRTMRIGVAVAHP